MGIRPFLRNQDSPYWNRYYETMPREQLDRLHWAQWNLGVPTALMPELEEHGFKE